jgi:hypothetical protein
MSAPTKTLVPATIALSLAGCAALHAGDSRATESMLTAAGFQMKRADTAEKLAHLQTLPAGKILRREQQAQTYYVYADPNGCRCLYAGRQPEYERYRELARQQTAADEEALVTDEASDFRLWGPGPWP